MRRVLKWRLRILELNDPGGGGVSVVQKDPDHLKRQ